MSKARCVCVCVCVWCACACAGGGHPGERAAADVGVGKVDEIGAGRVLEVGLGLHHDSPQGSVAGGPVGRLRPAEEVAPERDTALGHCRQPLSTTAQTQRTHAHTAHTPHTRTRTHTTHTRTRTHARHDTTHTVVWPTRNEQRRLYRIGPLAQSSGRDTAGWRGLGHCRKPRAFAGRIAGNRHPVCVRGCACRACVSCVCAVRRC